MTDRTNNKSDSGSQIGFDLERSFSVAPSQRDDAGLASADLLNFAKGRKFATVLADPPWQFTNKTGKIAPEHKRLSRYGTMKLDEIKLLPVSDIAANTAHLYLWCPNAMLPDGLAVMKAWGFTYKSNIVWHKVRKDGGSDGRGVGFYFRNVTELLLFGVRGKNARTLAQAGRAIRRHRVLQSRSLPRIVWSRYAKRLDDVGQSGRR